AGHQAGPVIVQIADRVGQRVGVVVAVVMAGFGQGRGDNGGREQARGGEKLQLPHHDTPVIPPKRGFFGRSGPPLTQIPPKSAEKWPQGRFFLRIGILNEFPTQSRQSLGAWSGSGLANPCFRRLFRYPSYPCASRSLPWLLSSPLPQVRRAPTSISRATTAAMSRNTRPSTSASATRASAS